MALDTLEIAKRLRNAGFSEPQAEAVTGVVRDAHDSDMAQLATKADLAPLATKAELAALKSDVVQLESTMKAEFVAVRSEIEILRRDLTIRLGSMIVVATGTLLAAKFFG